MLPQNQEDQATRELIQRAEQVVLEAENSLQASEDTLRGLGLDPEKVRTVLSEQPMTQEQRDEVEKLFRQDMEEIEQQVSQEAAYLRQNTTSKSSGGRRPRNMV